MALIVADRVQETSTTTGTGALTLLGATTAHRAASTVCANGDTLTYYAEAIDASKNPTGDWETGLGTWGTGNILTRTTIYASSNAGAAVSWAAGTKRIGLGLVATAALGPTSVTGLLTVSSNGIQFSDSSVQLTAADSIDISTTAPGSPTAGSLWWSSEEGKLKIYYNDGTSSQWVDATTGSAGTAGLAATVAIGTTSTGNPGTSASVTNSGSSSAATFNFTVPRGATVALNGTPVVTVNPNVNPSIANSGASGDSIYQFSLPRAATVGVGTTSTLSPGSSASLTNTGTNGDAVLNFGVPRGATVALNGTPVVTVNPNVNPSIANSGASGDSIYQFSLPRAATVTVGTTTTGAAGSSTSLTNTGTNGDAVLNFTVPRGDTGVTGTAATIATGTTTTGAAGSSASVTNSGTSAAAVFNFTIPRGDTGVTGTAATIAAGTTTTGTAGTNASVTNSGTSAAAVFNFTIPRGDTGLTGPMGPKSTLLGYPTTADTKVTLFYTTSALTISKIVSILPGGSATPSCSFNIRYGSDHSAAGTVVTAAVITTTNTTTGTTTTSFSSATISAGSFVWLEVTAVSGTVPALSVTLEF